MGKYIHSDRKVDQKYAAVVRLMIQISMPIFLAMKSQSQLKNANKARISSHRQQMVKICRYKTKTSIKKQWGVKT